MCVCVSVTELLAERVTEDYTEPMLDSTWREGAGGGGAYK